MQNLFYICRYTLALFALVFVWILIFMVLGDHVIAPLDRILPFLLPWKFTFAAGVGGEVADRMQSMQAELEATKMVASVALVVMSASFAIFSGYLALIYQQKQRRLRDNRLLQMKNMEIARRNEFIRYISATIGHEFKNNLARIKRRFDMLGDLPTGYRESIYGNFDKLFSDIDIFKKIADEREAGLVTFERVDLLELLQEISGNYCELAEIKFSVEHESSNIFAAVPLLRTVFENIIDNAIKYRKDEHHLARVTITLSMDRDDKRRYVLLSFRDQGIGMDEQTAGQCFYKGSSARGGWGHGMYYSKYVVGLHAGKIRVGMDYTEPGLGTEILIHLPYVEEALPAV